jgi:choline dehydrogenase-like flavoprotein
MASAFAAVPVEELAGRSYDIVIVGTGMGGGTLAYGLRNSGARILLIERGDFIPSEPENWDADAVFVDGRYKAKDRWQAADGSWFEPGTTYAVGGNSKVYGASLPRFQTQDFQETLHADGVSPAWPFDYTELERHYGEAELLLGVHGEPEAGLQQTRTTDYPFPPVPDEPEVAEIRRRLRERGYKPSYLPLGIDLAPGHRCQRVGTCDGYVCKLDAKADSDVRCVRPALASGNVEIVTGAYATRVLSDDAGRATAVEIQHGDQRLTVDAGIVVVSCGAINSAALLLRSRTASGQVLANSSNTVGRNYMVHNNSIMLAVKPVSRNHVTFQKTLYLNDFYDRGTEDHPFPLGHIQLIGKVREQMTKSQAPWAPAWAHRYLTSRSTDWWIFSEDLPDPANRVELTEAGGIRLHRTANNTRAHTVLVREARKIARAAGYPITFTRQPGIDVCSHQAGTVRAGFDPQTSALDPWCRAHDVENLYVVDASFFPSLPVMNPALTIAANALRVAEHIQARMA